MDALDVYLNGAPMGKLRRVGKGVRFSYTAEVAAGHMGEPLLSTALPVREDEYDAAATRNWFRGLLPENARLLEICRVLRLDPADWFAVLAEIGWECAGAVSVFPEGQSFLGREEGFRKVSKEELADRLRALPRLPLDDRDSLRVSLGGYQEKICLTLGDAVMKDGYAEIGTVLLPERGAVSTHILKPQPAEFSGMIEGEAWAMMAARCVTLCAETALLRLESAPETLVVRRFDRCGSDGRFERIHQEDCCQAMGNSPDDKYATDAGKPKKSDPSFKRIVEILRRYAVDPDLQVQRLFRQMLVNCVLGNTDAHAKNYALLHDDAEGVTLAPMYDVVPACEITPLVKAIGMRIGGAIRFDRVDRDRVEAEAKSWGMPSRVIGALMGDTCDALLQGIEEADRCYPQAAARHSTAARERVKQLMKG